MPSPDDQINPEDMLNILPGEPILASWYEQDAGWSYCPAVRVASSREDIIKVTLYKPKVEPQDAKLKPGRRNREFTDGRTEYRLFLPSPRERDSCLEVMERWRGEEE